MKDNADIEKSLAKIPKGHRELVHGFHIKLEPGNTLHGDDGHVGIIMTNPKRQIKVASPWNYPREFALLHEVGHLVFEKFVRGTDLEKQWKKICANTKDKKKNEPPEELFCHAYANTYCKHQVVIHTHPEWEKFIKDLPE